MTSVAEKDQVRARLARMTPEQRAAFVKASIPRVVPQYMAHTPWPKQQVFLCMSGREAMYGGAAGGGKSDALLMAALQYVDVPGYSALILRRTWPDLNAPGAILDRARDWLSDTDAHMQDGGRLFTFPSGAKLTFGYIQHEKDKYKFQSAEYQFVGFDELTQFPETQYEYLFSRLRGPDLKCMICSTPVRDAPGGWRHTSSKWHAKCGQAFPDPKMVAQFGPALQDGMRLWNVPLRVRSATNPGNIGHEWVYRRFIDIESRSPGTMFMPAALADNPALNQEAYRESLEHMTGVEKERLLNGDWAAYEGGNVFQRTWWDYVDNPPEGRRIIRTRYWDLAASEGEGDYTVGTLVSLHEGVWYIEHQIRGQWGPAATEKIVRQTAVSDGRNVRVRMEQEPGSSGKALVDHYRRNVLQGFNFDSDRPTGSKVQRATPLAVAAENKLVKLVLGQWNKRFVDEFDLFPHGKNDDQVDSASGAMNDISLGVRGPRLLV